MSGCEWVVDAYGCQAAALADLPRLQALFARIIQELSLHPVGETNWRQFPDTGGITGLCLLAESHLACHTFPEYGLLCLNLFCCRLRPEWDFAGNLEREFAARTVRVRRLERHYRDHEPESRELSELRRADPVSLV
jgi:S-adenosylmethionine decarboxylase